MGVGSKTWGRGAKYGNSLSHRDGFNYNIVFPASHRS